MAKTPKNEDERSPRGTMRLRSRSAEHAAKRHAWSNDRGAQGQTNWRGEQGQVKYWWRHWLYATVFGMIAGATWHVWWSPIEWWTDGYTLTPTAMLFAFSV